MKKLNSAREKLDIVLNSVPGGLAVVGFGVVSKITFTISVKKFNHKL